MWTGDADGSPPERVLSLMAERSDDYDEPWGVPPNDVPPALRKPCCFILCAWTIGDWPDAPCELQEKRRLEGSK